jgi:hypothetical protein
MTTRHPAADRCLQTCSAFVLLPPADYNPAAESYDILLHPLQKYDSVFNLALLKRGMI